MNALLSHLSQIMDNILIRMTDFQTRLQEEREATHPDNRVSSANLIDYLAFRADDLTPLQEKLASIGLSSLGRSEAAIRAQIHRVKTLIDGLNGIQPDIDDLLLDNPVQTGQRNLAINTAKLFGAPPEDQATRIMVTLPTHAANNPELVTTFMQAGMNVARINCAHDTPEIWRAIASTVREVSTSLHLPCQIFMDLAGPKLRTGPMPEGFRIARIKPMRDVRGRVVNTARVLFYLEGSRPPASGDAIQIPLSTPLDGLPPIQRITVTDTRDRHREMTVLSQDSDFLLVSVPATVYLETGQTLTLHGHSRHLTVEVGRLPAREGYLTLQTGSRLRLLRHQETARPERLAPDGSRLSPAEVACSLPEAIDATEIGHTVKLDDGKFTAVVLDRDESGLLLEITDTPPGGGKLRAEKGINFPDTEIPLVGLTQKDQQDLDTVCEIADSVGLSFVNTVEDVLALQAALSERNGGHLGLVLKIETRRAYQNLPYLLLTALRSEKVGVMIARGDLGVEVGWRRMASLQDEILWVCAAAHIPTIWATQVLETMAKTGQPTRSEITDAAVSQRAECVMLNKGPFMARAIRMLNRVLKTMESRQYKKSPRLPALYSAPEKSQASEAVHAAKPVTLADPVI